MSRYEKGLAFGAAAFMGGMLFWRLIELFGGRYEPPVITEAEALRRVEPLRPELPGAIGYTPYEEAEMEFIEERGWTREEAEEIMEATRREAEREIKEQIPTVPGETKTGVVYETFKPEYREAAVATEREREPRDLSELRDLTETVSRAREESILLGPPPEPLVERRVGGVTLREV